MNAETKQRVQTLLQEVIRLIEEDKAQQTAEETDLIVLTGQIGRPDLKEVKGYPLYTFGLGIRRPVDARLEWVNCAAWQDTAKWANENLVRGQTVSVHGRWETKEYADRQTGELRESKTFVVVHFQLDDIAA